MVHWSIAIGINQYQYFQPLMYARRDAQVVREFLINEAAVPSQHCFLLTDLPLRSNQTTIFPTRDRIQACLTQMCQQRLQPGHFLWVFFSGYGMQVDGKDYLMPIDGDPAQVSTTGIPIEQVFSLLETAPTQNIVLMLDVNRSQSVLAGEGIGDQTALLAREHGIPTILSCLPEQFSHETLALRQGLFTTALLEGLRYQGCVTLEQLVRYLNSRLPELSDQHWRPRQEPFAIIPAEKKHQFIVPEEAAITLNRPETPVKMAGMVATEPTRFYANRPQSITSFAPDSSWAAPPSGFGGRYATALLSPERDEVPPSSDAEPFAAESDKRAIDEEIVRPIASPDSVDALFWKRVLTWSSLLAAVLLLGVLLRNLGRPAGEGEAPLEEGVPTTQPQAEVEAEPSSAPGVQPPDAEAGSPLDSAYIAVRIRDFVEAKQQLAQVPEEQRRGDYRRILEEANKGLLSDAKILLTRMRELTTENQASDFVEAIEIANQVKPGEPQYQEAQEYIERWSRVMLDMAQGRADRRNDSSTSIAAANYSTAINTVHLIPNYNPDVYQQGQEAIAHWSQKLFDLAHDRAAEAKYDVAIQAAELIPADAPVYAEAQAAIAQWETMPSLLVIPTP